MADSILIQLGIADYTNKLKDWVKSQIKDSPSKIGGLKYDEDKDTIYVVDTNNKKIGSEIKLSDLIVDGMLQKVEAQKDPNTGEPTGKFIFTFNKAIEGTNDKSIEVDFSQYMGTYKGDGVTIGLTDNKFSVIGIGANLAETTEQIVVKGGPLANYTSSN